MSSDKLKIRRKDNKALPEANEMRKRDTKGGEKSQSKKKEEKGEDHFDENGKFIMAEKDFSDP